MQGSPPATCPGALSTPQCRLLLSMLSMQQVVLGVTQRFSLRLNPRVPLLACDIAGRPVMASMWAAGMLQRVCGW